MKSLFFLVTLVLATFARAQETRVEKAVFGFGCFWCAEATFEQQPGVIDVVSGYAGGDEPNPTYHQVGTGKTGHAEAIEVTFDPTKTSYEKLLEFFWKTHDPTDPRGVEPDFGKQYRSMILTSGEAQSETAKKSKAEAQKHFKKPIATEIAPLKHFYPAEDYHQNYVRNNPGDPYVRNVSIPKLKKLGLKVPSE
jgi:peptide-methionine (S)-S-oxide reductase